MPDPLAGRESRFTNRPRLPFSRHRHLLDGLAEADELGIIHRDLKPANIMSTRADGGVAQPRILDFGLSRLEGSSITARGATVGTPSHISPEQRTGSPLDGRSDLYTLGIVLYECVAGKLPYEGATPVEAMMHHLRTSAESLSALLQGYCVDPASVAAATGDDDGPTRHDLRVLDLPDDPDERPRADADHRRRSRSPPFRAQEARHRDRQGHRHPSGR